LIFIVNFKLSIIFSPYLLRNLGHIEEAFT